MSPDAEARLRKLALEHDGELSPAIVVDDARSSDSPLHEYFEWDDAVAAEKYRHVIARGLIASVRIERLVDEKVVRSVAWVRNPDKAGNEQGYAAVEDIRLDRKRAWKAMLYEIQCAESRMRRARMLAKDLGFEEEVDAILAAMASLREEDGEKVAVE